MPVGKAHTIGGNAPKIVYCKDMENNATQMATQIFNIWENMEAWDDIMGQMCAFVNDTHADVDMAYDWVC